MTDPANGTCLEVELGVELEDFPLEAAFSACQELVVLFGPSGAGKTTILRALAGLVTPQSGRIVLNGRVLFDAASGVNLPPQARRVGYVPQQYGLFPHMTIAENIAYGLPARSRAERHQQAARWIELMQLAEQAQRRPSEVSGGQQQRAALARAMASKPELLLMDEPFAALDQELRSHLRREIRSLAGTFQLPILVVTHDPQEAYSLADSMLVYSRGRQLQAGSRESIFTKPATPALGRLLGMTNVFPAQVLRSDSSGITLSWLGHKIHLPAAPGVKAGPVQVGLRPDQIGLGTIPNEPSDLLMLAARLVEIAPAGFDRMLRFDVSDTSRTVLIDVRTSGPAGLDPDPIRDEPHLLRIDPASIHIFPGAAL